ncbi:outer membrane autotransporter protein [Ereboglobus sp. PH5-10]|uniref:autotransporter outer membrane beta-barrel domain-containing protein n=1 Tax=Ereboglobus sp. PH5-10 TaxID=2940629 RepID=UPI002406194D|nr:autotransporter outer membrane beta-barrel domain-containing protein [Ereboglobus sp. PH5-10]MDF9827568.1 outer membrane autotransporter protein [Ereboglobus sp. PH5-10]
MKTSLNNPRTFFAAIFLTACALSPLRADEAQWQGTGTGDWSRPENWTPAAPSATGTAYIDNSGTAVVANSTFEVGGIVVGSNGAGGLILGTDAVVTATAPTAGNLYIGENAGGNGSLIMWSNASLETLHATIGSDGTGSVSLHNNASLKTDGAHIGLNAGAVGTVSVDGNATWDAGTLHIGGSSSAAGSWGTGQLTIQGSGAVTSSDNIIGAGVDGSGEVKVSGNGQWTIGTALTVGDYGSGLLEIRNNAKVVSGTESDLSSAYLIGFDAAGTVSIYDNGIWDMTEADVATHEFAIGGSSNGTLNINDQGSVLFPGVIALGNYSTGVGTINLNGGVLEVAGLEKKAGTAVVSFNSGTIRAAADSADFISGIPTVAVLDGGAGLDTNGYDVTIASNLYGIGGLTKTGAGSLTFSSAQSYSGTTTIKAGVITAGVANIIMNSAALVVDGTFNLNGYDQQVGDLSGASSGVLSGIGKLTVNNLEDSTYSGALKITGTLVKAGSGTLTMDGNTAAADFGGLVSVTAGQLNIASNNALGAGTIDNGSVIEIADGVTVFSNTITGAGITEVSSSGVNLTGTQTNYAGTWNITGSGTVASQENLGADATVEIETDGSLTLRTATAGNFQWSNTLRGSGTLTVNLTGTADVFSMDTTTTGAGFQGAVELKNSAYVIDDSTEALLANATLSLGTGNVTQIATSSGTRQIGGITLDGGLLQFGEVEPMAGQVETVLKTGTLTVGSGSIQVGFKDPGLIPSGTNLAALEGTPLLKQDDGDVLMKLIEADWASGNAANLVIHDGSGAVVSNSHSINLSHDGVTTDAVATYDYVASTGASSDGLYISYGLKQLDILDGRTMALDHDDGTAAGSTLNTKITGDGSLDIQATDWIMLSNAESDYTGTTSVSSGTLRLGANGALGQTSMLAIENGAAFDAGNFAQEIGSLDAKEGSILALNSGTLQLNADGEIRGTVTGSTSANLIINSSTLAVYGANAELHSKITINADSAALLDNAGGLGDGIIEFTDSTGSLTVSSTSNGTLENTLAGSGRLIKEGANTLTIAQANSDFEGAVDINEGRLLATHISALNIATVNVAADAIYELSGVSGTLSNTVAGSGTLALTNNAAVTITRANTIASTLGVDMNNARLIAAATGMSLGNVYMNSSRLSFVAGTPKTMTIARLDGVDSILSLNVDFDEVRRLATGKTWTVIDGGLAGDYLQISENASGVFGVNIVSTGQAPAEGSYVELINFTGAAGDDTAQYHLVDIYGNQIDELDLGLNKFVLIKGTENTGLLNDNAWYLQDTGQSSVVDAAIAAAAMLGRDWNYAMDSMHQRMGEIRMEREALAPNAANKGNIWLRGRGYQLNADADMSGRSYTQYGYGVTAGGDRAFNTENATWLLGVFADVGAVDLDLDNSGESQSRTVAFGVYGSWLHKSGWYADAIIKGGHQEQTIDAKSPNGHVTNGEDNTNMGGISVEIGRRFNWSNGWWLEPSVQASMSWFGKAEYETTSTVSAFDINMESLRSQQYRVGIRTGRQFRDTKWHPYGKLAAAKVSSSGGLVEILDREFTPDCEGWRFEVGLGAMYRLTDISQVYLEYEYATADNYDRPWAFNLGYRVLW